MFFSLIIPVYNRPDEVQELLDSLTQQTYTDFEVIIVEDGSMNKCDTIAQTFANQLVIRYFYQQNSGQGFARNFGFAQAKGDYFLVFDSDCLIPANYLQIVFDAIQTRRWDAFGGPDKAHASFSPIQKAISYAMTSLFSTGGIRGNQKSAEKFRPRSFNMGISRAVFEKTQGYKITRMGEDIEFSIRIEKLGFKVGLIPEAFVYHKRRANFRQFYKQLHFFGRARVNVWRFFPDELKLVHLFPAGFVLFLVAFLLTPFVGFYLFEAQVLALLLYITLIFSDALAKTKNLYVSLLSIGAVFVQLSAYGIGFLTEWFKKSNS
ncbi:MAG: glycosyltransferase [Microscillaceae bacterium]|jgi:glycosyltransferase involved in cell wall biosynthesis|nr:glycosyltransferase [Microscillaceae bacterium]